MGKKSQSYESYTDPRYEEAMAKQSALAEQQQNWYLNDVYPWVKEAVQENIDASNANRELSLEDYDYWKQQLEADTSKINERAQDYASRWTDTYLPAEQKLIEDSQKYLDGSYATQQGELAAALTGQQFQNQQNTNAMQAAAYGVDPNSRPDYQSSSRASGITQAGAEAAAYNQAIDAASELGWSRMTDLASLGQNYSGLSNSATNAAASTNATAGSASTSALASSQQANNNIVSNVGNYNNIGLSSYQGLQKSWSDYGNNAKAIQDNENSRRAAEAQANAQKSQSIMGGIGTAVGVAASFF